jgi:multidrug resistance efflux pump
MNANLGQTLQLEASAPKKPSLMKKPIVRAALTAALLGALIFFGQWIYHRSTHVYEIDARLRSTLYIVSSELPGRLESFPLKEGMTVNEGQMVAKLDSTRAELLLSELSLELQKLDAQIEEMETSKQVLQHQLESRMQSAGANVDAAGASVKEAELSKKQAEDELRRTVSLAAQKLVSQRQLEQAQTAAKQAAENLNVVRAKATSSSAALSESRANAAQVDVLEKQIQRLRVNRESIQVQRERQASEVKKHTITSPVTGLGRCQHQGDRPRPPQARPAGAHHRRWLSGAGARRQGGPHRQCRHQPVCAAAQRQPQRQLHQDHPAHSGQDQRRAAGWPAQAGDDGRGGHRCLEPLIRCS